MLALRSPRKTSRPCDATPLRRSPRIAASSTVTHYRPDGSVTKARRHHDVSTDIALMTDGYVQRLAAITLTRGRDAFRDAIVNLYMYASSNPMPLVRNAPLRLILLNILKQALVDSDDDAILEVAERFIDVTDDLKGLPGYVATV